ncbi:hypothetical protein DFJ77DRAFT_436759 [Powellomyces hirtus]|nr:hypothetical protein DFJ77DRAFT_436759 [Powellomyces hirtus]
MSTSADETFKLLKRGCWKLRLGSLLGDVWKLRLGQSLAGFGLFPVQLQTSPRGCLEIEAREYATIIENTLGTKSSQWKVVDHVREVVNTATLPIHVEALKEALVRVYQRVVDKPTSPKPAEEKARMLLESLAREYVENELLLVFSVPVGCLQSTTHAGGFPCFFWIFRYRLAAFNENDWVFIGIGHQADSITTGSSNHSVRSQPVPKNPKEAQDGPKIASKLMAIQKLTMESLLRHRRRAPERLATFGAQSRNHHSFNHVGILRSSFPPFSHPVISGHKWIIHGVDSAPVPWDMTEMLSFIEYYEAILKWTELIKLTVKSFRDVKLQTRLSRKSFFRGMKSLGS